MRWNSVFVLGLILLGWSFTTCNNDEPQLIGNSDRHSRQELVDAGYYVYVFPKDFANEAGWAVNVSMYSFDDHCKSSEYPWNPMTIDYSNAADAYITITISFYNSPFFDERAIIEEIPLDIDWIPNQTGEYYYHDSGATMMMFSDRLGMEIVMMSSLQLEELIPLISKLEYVGPDLDSVGNPWFEACK